MRGETALWLVYNILKHWFPDPGGLALFLGCHWGQGSSICLTWKVNQDPYNVMKGADILGKHKEKW